MSSKRRLSASVDAELLDAAEEAVGQGRVDTVSAWVNSALQLKLEHDQRLRALAELVAAYEDEHGEITPAEMRDATRRARARALTSRTIRSKKKSRSRRGGS